MESAKRLEASAAIVHEVVDLRVRVPLWLQIEEQLKVQEIDEFRRVVGERLIDDNQMCFEELVSLVEMLADFRSLNDQLEARQSLSRKLLPTPPAMQLLQREIQLVVDNLKRKFAAKNADSSGSGIESIVPQITKAEKAILDYALNQKPHNNHLNNVFERPSTPRPRSSQSNTPPLSDRSDYSSASSSSSRPGTAGSSSANVLSELSFADKLNIYSLDQVGGMIRDYLTAEKTVLEEDIEFIRECLETEDQFNLQVTTFKTPSVQEMREVNTKLSKAWIEEEQKEQQQRFLDSLPSASASNPSGFSRRDDVSSLPAPGRQKPMPVPPISSFSSSSSSSSNSSVPFLARPSTPSGVSLPLYCQSDASLSKVASPPPPRISSSLSSSSNAFSRSSVVRNSLSADSEPSGAPAAARQHYQEQSDQPELPVAGRPSSAASKLRSRVLLARETPF